MVISRRPHLRPMFPSLIRFRSAVRPFLRRHRYVDVDPSYAQTRPYPVYIGRHCSGRNTHNPVYSPPGRQRNPARTCHQARPIVYVAHRRSASSALGRGRRRVRLGIVDLTRVGSSSRERPPPLAWMVSCSPITEWCRILRLASSDVSTVRFDDDALNVGCRWL